MPSSKKCFRCGKVKKLEQFYRHSQTNDGHLGKCKSCTKKDVKERWKDPDARERIRAYDRKRFKDPERRKKIKEYAKRRSVGKIRAQKKLSNALRSGKIVRKACEVCGNKKSQGHHPDYRRPLFVKWLCFYHHRIEHGQNPKKK